MKIGEIGPIAAAQLSEALPTSAVDRQAATEKRVVLAAVKELDLPELNLPNRSLNIAYDRETKQSIVQIVDQDSGEVVKQIPGKDVVERAKYYRELSGL